MELALASLAFMCYYLSRTSMAKTSKSTKGTTSALGITEQYTFHQSAEKELTKKQLVLKALRQGRTNEAVSLIQRLPETIEGQVPAELAHQLLVYCAKKSKVCDMPGDLKTLAGKVDPSALEEAVADALRVNDLTACRQLHMISGLLSISKSPKVFEMLAKAYASDATALHVLVDEASTPLARPFAELALEVCVRMKDSRLAAEIFEKVSKTDAVFLRNIVEKSATTDADGTLLDATCLGGDSERNVDGNSELSHVTNKEIAMRANDIRSCGKNGDLKGATKVFDRLGSQSNDTLILNSMLDACISCKDFDKATETFNQARHQNLADVISYNTMMKGYIANGQEGLARKLLAEIPKKGLNVTRTSYHGLLNARVNARDFANAWKLVAEMQAAGIAPNAVTCSILLKGKLTSLSDVSRVLALIDAMQEPMDEVLFLSVVEACIRTGRLDLLSRQTEKFMKQGASACLTAPTYGSMIKAYGHARDLRRVWHLWDQMLFHRVQPTSVTLGCMIEALVANGHTADAWALARKMWSEESTRPLVNTVIYSSLLKGFAQTKETEKVMALYEEMKANGVQANTITYNTILNAFAQGGAMHRVPALLEDMKAAVPPVEPDIVTYSTIVKGFCNAGNLEKALRVLDDMKSSGKHVPDEVMYNSLLGGCAKEQRPDEAIELLNDMRKHNVAPSNYTLSMLVKLMGRCRRINQAFNMLEDISREYGLKINIQVYTCLIQGCFNAGQAGKALALHEKIMKEGLAPDSMTYTVLVRGCVQGGLLDKAVELAMTAYGRGPTTQAKGSSPGLNAGCFDELVSALGGPTSAEAKELMVELGDRQPASSGKGHAVKGKGKGGSRY